MAQSFLSAIEKPVPATALSVSVALVFPVTVLAVLWKLGLDGIWLNPFGTALLAALLALVLLGRIKKEIGKEGPETRKQNAPPENPA